MEDGCTGSSGKWKNGWLGFRYLLVIQYYNFHNCKLHFFSISCNNFTLQVKGIKSLCVLAEADWFDVVQGFVIDYMHGQ